MNKTMFDLSFKSEPMFQFSVKLCSAVKKHECLYLQKASVAKTGPPEWEAAWKVVAAECGESVENCKWRWKNIRKSFHRCLRRDTNKYYLHSYMDFLVPHLLQNAQYETIIDGKVSSEEGKNVGDEHNAESDSDTTSADETHILKSVINKKLQDETLTSQTDDGKGKTLKEVGDFVINEIDEGGSAKNNNNNDDDQDDDDDMDETVETIRSRLRYRRACKRGLDAELTNELNAEPKQEEKRPRRSVERRKDLSSDVSLEDFSTDRKSLSNTKKIEVKINKIKFNKTLSTQPKCVEPKSVNENIPTYKSIAVETANSVNTYYPKNSSANTKFLPQPAKKPVVVDISTITDFQTKDSSTQYEAAEQEPLDFDETFINSLKPQLKLMNGRQKMNFKRKVFHSLMEVFDDSANFPNSNEYIVLPPTGAPRFDTTTSGELRLMRELVSLVQAAKTTPEIVNATEKVPQSRAMEKPSKQPIAEMPKTSSPFLMSPTFDDDDISITNESLIDDREPLPRSLEEIIDLRSQDDVLGLPRRIIHKVVKVSGTNGSTIVTGEGKQRRVYRIYPKAANVDASRAITTKNNGNNIGTFYVTPSKVANTTNSSADNHNSANRTKNNTPNFTFRSVNKSSHNSRETFVSTNAAPNRSSANATGSKTPITPKGHVTPILNQSTGLFTISSAASNTLPSNNNHTKSPMLPPISSSLFSNSLASNSSMRIVSVKSNTNTSADMKNQNSIMQRRYSICGPTTSAAKPIPVLAKSQTKPFIQKITYSSNGNPLKSAVSNIMISKPVSLKPASNNSLTNVKTFLANTSKNASSPTSEISATNNVVEAVTSNEEKSTTTNNTETSKTVPESPPSKQQQPLPEIPILETAGTISADTFADPLYVKPTIKSEPLD